MWQLDQNKFKTENEGKKLRQRKKVIFWGKFYSCEKNCSFFAPEDDGSVQIAHLHSSNIIAFMIKKFSLTRSKVVVVKKATCSLLKVKY